MAGTVLIAWNQLRQRGEVSLSSSGSVPAAGFARALRCAATPDVAGPGVPVPVAAQAVPCRIRVPAGLLSARRRAPPRLEPLRSRRKGLRLFALWLGHLRRERFRLLHLGPGRRLPGPPR